MLIIADLSAGRRDYPKDIPIFGWTISTAAQLVSDPLTVKNSSYDSHHFHTSDKNIQSDPYLDVLSFSLSPLYNL